MKILFVHQNFPGQYKHLAPVLASIPGNSVVAMRHGVDTKWQGINIVGYSVHPKRYTSHPYLGDLNVQMMRGEAAAQRAMKLKKDGFSPDVIVGHPGWGETVFLKHVWPNARQGLYCEFFYGGDSSDVDFDTEFPSQEELIALTSRLQMKNAIQIFSLEAADRGISPTRWQASRYPAKIRKFVDVIHDGIDTQALRSNENVSLQLNGHLNFNKSSEVITFVSRNLEPYRGYHQFLRALPLILEKRPQARIIIVGGDGVRYGPRPAPGTTWRARFWDEVKDHLDTTRVHFLGQIPYSQFVSVLQLSSVHVYLTYPFVLSWSLLEAMSIECSIVASNTAPIVEVLENGKSALLVDFFSPVEIANAVVKLLEDRELARVLGSAAREAVVSNYDLRTVCLPSQLQWLNHLSS